MKIEKSNKVNLTKEEIEEAIKEYIEKRFSESLDFSGTKVDFRLKDISDDDDRVYKAEVSLSFRS